MSFLSSMIMMFDPIKRMTGVMQSLQRGLAAAESVFTFWINPKRATKANKSSAQTLEILNFAMLYTAILKPNATA